MSNFPQSVEERGYVAMANRFWNQFLTVPYMLSNLVQSLVLDLASYSRLLFLHLPVDGEGFRYF